LRGRGGVRKERKVEEKESAKGNDGGKGNEPRDVIVQVGGRKDLKGKKKH